MNDSNLYQSLGQVPSEQAAEIFRDFLRGSVREMIGEVMAAEVTALCGPKHDPADGNLFRAGSTSGRVIVEGRREEASDRACDSGSRMVRRWNCRWPVMKAPVTPHNYKHPSSRR